MVNLHGLGLAGGCRHAFLGCSALLVSSCSFAATLLQGPDLAGTACIRGSLPLPQHCQQINCTTACDWEQTAGHRALAAVMAQTAMPTMHASHGMM